MSNRYVIYRLLNHMVSFRALEHGQKVTGFVDEVYRDIISGEVRITVKGHSYRFKEPPVIRDTENEVIFVYGDVRKRDVSDTKLFDEMRKQQFKETVDETMHRLDPIRKREVRFKIGDKKNIRRRPSLMRGIPASECHIPA